jgi:ElaB/YqjD/DUF883 family membrane-anchored ribosome-binding protein
MSTKHAETQVVPDQAHPDHGVASAVAGASGAAAEMAGVVGRNAQRARDAVQVLISDHPWRAAAIFGAIGLALGAMLRSGR